MLWYKSFVETRRWFILAVLVLAAQVVALYVAYPMDPLTSYPNGALGVLPDEMARLRTGDFRGYVWVRWFSTTMLLFWPVFAIAMAGTDLESTAGREYLLSLPVTRRRIVLTRTTVALAQIAAFTVLPSLLLSAMAPLRGQHYPVQDALAHSGILLVGGFGLFGLTMFLRTTLNDAAAYVATGGLVVLGLLFTFVIEQVTPYSIFRVMNGADYFFHQRVPWTGLALSAGVGSLLVVASLVVIERRDY
jgi:ABC-type transport system involved in multi-copper enzyme maturation permease subunit